LRRRRRDAIRFLMTSERIVSAKNALRSQPYAVLLICRQRRSTATVSCFEEVAGRQRLLQNRWVQLDHFFLTGTSPRPRREHRRTAARRRVQQTRRRVQQTPGAARTSNPWYQILHRLAVQRLQASPQVHPTHLRRRGTKNGRCQRILQSLGERNGFRQLSVKYRVQHLGLRDIF
jgi:hypothetical protein